MPGMTETTTAAAIRDMMIASIEALTPSLHAGDKFRRYREQIEGGPFRDWAEKHPDVVLRRFSLRYLRQRTPALVSNTEKEGTSDIFELQVAYPNSYRFGDGGLLDIDDVCDKDQTQLYATIGPPGYASLDAPATVLMEEDWSAEQVGPVTIATIRLRVHYYRDVQGFSTNDPVTVSVNGSLLATGDEVTGVDVSNVVIQSGRIKVTTELCVPDGEQRAACHLYARASDGTWVRIFSQQYGDNSKFASAAIALPDRVSVLEATDDAVEIALIWDAFALDTPDLGGVGIAYLDFATSPGHNYAQGQSNPNFKYITSIRLVKLVRVQRGEMGYFLGWHSEPRVGPLGNQIPAQNNNTGWGERHFGTDGSAVSFSSAGVIARHPAWGNKPEFDAAGFAPTDNRAAWMGIDDPTEAPWDTALAIATQAAGFPHEQTTGPWWVADLYNDVAAVPYCRFIVLRDRLEVGSCQFQLAASGVLVVLFVNEIHSDAGIPYRHQLFLGVEPYDADFSSAYINEPTAALQGRIAELAAAVDWPPT